MSLEQDSRGSPLLEPSAVPCSLHPARCGHLCPLCAMQVPPWRAAALGSRCLCTRGGGAGGRQTPRDPTARWAILKLLRRPPLPRPRHPQGTRPTFPTPQDTGSSTVCRPALPSLGGCKPSIPDWTETRKHTSTQPLSRKHTSTQPIAQRGRTCHP